MNNARGTWTLFTKECSRFMKVKTQTVLAPALTALLYMLVFRYAMNDRTVVGFNVDYITFLAPGLIMMSILQNAFANTASSLLTSKIMHVHVYLLMAPLTAFEVALAFLTAACLRSMLIALVLWLVFLQFMDVWPQHLFLSLYFMIMGSLIMGSLGFCCGIWAQKFDDMSLITNFVVLPLTFLSGVFYSTQQLPELWQTLNSYNPFYYLIDGFRYSVLGISESDPQQAIMISSISSIVAVCLSWFLWKKGWKLKT
ncbi:MAG: ABC transporter permease [Mariprofundaceae bacterium]|nr:ABC transporter permease [Mariprofundaceae bacterium]